MNYLNCEIMKSIFRKILILLFCVYLIYGCKKEEIPFAQYESTNVDILTGDTAIFVGTWSWVYSDHYYGWCDNENNYELLTPITENCEFEIKFYKSGYLSYHKNDSLKSQYRTSFQYFDFNSLNACGGNYIQFNIDLDGFEDLNLGGCISNDTLMCFAPGFLFYEKMGCETYHSWFTKM